jgi:ribonucleotide reductase alpha subunit
MQTYMKSPSTKRRTPDGNPELGRRELRHASQRSRHAHHELRDHGGHEHADVQTVPPTAATSNIYRCSSSLEAGNG